MNLIRVLRLISGAEVAGSPVRVVWGIGDIGVRVSIGMFVFEVQERTQQAQYSMCVGMGTIWPQDVAMWYGTRYLSGSSTKGVPRYAALNAPDSRALRLAPCDSRLSGTLLFQSVGCFGPDGPDGVQRCVAVRVPRESATEPVVLFDLLYRCARSGH